MSSNLLDALKEASLTRHEAQKIFNEFYGVRIINGFEVVSGWKMPEPPKEGFRPCVIFHGGDGLDFFWWDPDLDEFPKNRTFNYKTYERNELYEFDGEDPLINPDTGGYSYKECQDAYAQLGFVVC